MNYLIDTNILTRLAEPGHSMHSAALNAVKRLIREGHKLYIVPQNLYEFWVVCTRPISVNGLGRTATEAASELTSIKSLFLLADDTPTIRRRYSVLGNSLFLRFRLLARTLTMRD